MMGQFCAMLAAVGLLFVLFWVGQYDLTAHVLARRIDRSGLTPIVLDVNNHWRIAGVHVCRRCLVLNYQRAADSARMSLRIQAGPRLLLSEPDGTAITGVVNSRGEFLCSTSRSGLAPRFRIVSSAQLAAKASEDRALLSIAFQRQAAERQAIERRARLDRARERRTARRRSCRDS